MNARNTLSCLALVAITLTSCDPNIVFEEHDKNFPKYRWQQENVLTFNPVIEDTSAQYNVYLELRHVYGFQFEEMKTLVVRTSPGNNVEVYTYSFPLFDANKEYLSECAEDICDRRVMVEEGITFPEKGTYRFEMTHQMPADPVPNVMEFGLVIEKQVPNS